MLSLINLSAENINDCLHLRVDSWQTNHVRPVAESIARAYVEPEQLIPLLITWDEKPVGFLQFRIYEAEKYLLLNQFLIDTLHQSKGYAVQALRQFTAYAETLEPFERIYCKIDIGNQRGRNVLENAGFMRGHVDIQNKKNEWVYIIR